MWNFFMLQKSQFIKFIPSNWIFICFYELTSRAWKKVYAISTQFLFWMIPIEILLEVYVLWFDDFFSYFVCLLNDCVAFSIINCWNRFIACIEHSWPIVALMFRDIRAIEYTKHIHCSFHLKWINVRGLHAIHKWNLINFNSHLIHVHESMWFSKKFYSCTCYCYFFLYAFSGPHWKSKYWRIFTQNKYEQPFRLL